MITSAILNILLNFVYWAVSQLPLVSNTSAIGSAMSTANPYVSSIAQVFPVVTLLSIVGFVLIFDTAWISYQIVRWVYQKIPGIN